jgi:hypothetical protein
LDGLVSLISLQDIQLVDKKIRPLWRDVEKTKLLKKNPCRFIVKTDIAQEV